jgi:hypothetical protein
MSDRLRTAAELTERVALSTSTVLDWFEDGRLRGSSLSVGPAPVREDGGRSEARPARSAGSRGAGRASGEDRDASRCSRRSRGRRSTCTAGGLDTGRRHSGRQGLSTARRTRCVTHSRRGRSPRACPRLRSRRRWGRASSSCRRRRPPSAGLGGSGEGGARRVSHQRRERRRRRTRRPVVNSRPTLLTSEPSEDKEPPARPLPVTGTGPIGGSLSSRPRSRSSGPSRPASCAHRLRSRTRKQCRQTTASSLSSPPQPGQVCTFTRYSTWS